jgi:hypothetical protein
MKKKTPMKPAAKKAAPKKPAAKSVAKKAAPAPKLQAKPVKAVPSEIASSTPEPHKPGVHLPSKPAPAYAQMQQRAWASKPPPHKLRFNK